LSKYYRSLTVVGVLLLLGACGGSGSDNEAPAAATVSVAANDGAGTQPAAGAASAAAATPPSGSAAEVEAVAGNGASGSGTIPTVPLAPPVPDSPAPPAAIAKMYINTQGGAEVVDKEEYLSATVRIESEVAAERIVVATEIRGRGNATWGFPKKPYRLKLGKATSILGMPAEKDWALLANYVDKTLARNKLAMTLGTRMGMAWTSRSRFVELYMNDEYRGVYEVFEHVKTGKDRVNVESLDRKVDVDPQTITGGWLLEVDKRKGEEVCWDTALKVTLCVKSPGLELADVETTGNPSAVQLAYIKGYVGNAERALQDMSTEQWRTYFDVPALIDWYLVNELMRNYDARLVSSVYLHKRRDGPLVFGPLWDFDIAGQFEYDDAEKPTGWWVRGSQWHQRMFARSSFRADVFQRWCALKRDNTIGGISATIDGIAATIGPEPVARNFQRWPVLGVAMTPFFNTRETTYQGEIDYLKHWLDQRVAWIDGEYNAEFGACPAP